MSAGDRNAERLLQHLDGSLDEAARQRLELAALEDDRTFDELTAVESELVDAYVRGELDEGTGRRIARLIERSPRLQAKAETTLALEVWGEDRRRGVAGRKPGGDADTGIAPRPRPSLGWLLATLALVALCAWLAFEQTALRSSLTALAAENGELRQRNAELERSVDRLEESSRALARRLAEIEGTGGRPATEQR